MPSLKPAEKCARVTAEAHEAFVNESPMSSTESILCGVAPAVSSPLSPTQQLTESRLRVPMPTRSLHDPTGAPRPLRSTDTNSTTHEAKAVQSWESGMATPPGAGRTLMASSRDTLPSERARMDKGHPVGACLPMPNPSVDPHSGPDVRPAPVISGAIEISTAMSTIDPDATQSSPRLVERGLQQTFRVIHVELPSLAEIRRARATERAKYEPTPPYRDASQRWSSLHRLIPPPGVGVSPFDRGRWLLPITPGQTDSQVLAQAAAIAAAVTSAIDADDRNQTNHRVRHVSDPCWKGENCTYRVVLPGSHTSVPLHEVTRCDGSAQCDRSLGLHFYCQYRNAMAVGRILQGWDPPEEPMRDGVPSGNLSFILRGIGGLCPRLQREADRN